MSEPDGSKPGIHQFLIASALDAELRRTLLEAPDEAFQNFDLSEEDKDLLRRPDHRLLPVLGAALSGQGESPPKSSAPAEPHALVPARSLPDVSLALTLVPCAQYVDGQLSTFAYAVWVNPLPEGADPATLPPPQGAALPGQPLAPLHVVIQVSAVQMQDPDGHPQVGLTASLRQSSNVFAPPPPEAAGRPHAPPFGSDLQSASVRTAVAAVRSAPALERYDRVVDLIRALRGGEVR